MRVHAQVYDKSDDEDEPFYPPPKVASGHGSGPRPPVANAASAGDDPFAPSHKPALGAMSESHSEDDMAETTMHLATFPTVWH